MPSNEAHAPTGMGFFSEAFVVTEDKETSNAGGKTSAYLSVNYPIEHNGFAFITIDEKSRAL